jgi:hypothetical protein
VRRSGGQDGSTDLPTSRPTDLQQISQFSLSV